MSEASATFNERRAKIDAAAIHGNPQFGKDQLAALNGQSLVDIAEALTALVGIGAELLDRMGGWERIGVIDDPSIATGHVPAAAVPDSPERQRGDDDDELDEAPDIELGDRVAASNNPGHELGVVVAAGISEGRPWVQYEDDEGEVSGKVWTEQLLVHPNPAPPETEATNPEDGAEQRRKAAEAHMGNINDEPKVKYEQVSYDAGKDGREFDVPIGIVGAPVKVKSKGGK